MRHSWFKSWHPVYKVSYLAHESRRTKVCGRCGVVATLLNRHLWRWYYHRPHELEWKQLNHTPPCRDPYYIAPVEPDPLARLADDGCPNHGNVMT